MLCVLVDEWILFIFLFLRRFFFRYSFARLLSLMIKTKWKSASVRSWQKRKSFKYIVQNSLFNTPLPLPHTHNLSCSLFMYTHSSVSAFFHPCVCVCALQCVYVLYFLYHGIFKWMHALVVKIVMNLCIQLWNIMCNKLLNTCSLICAYIYKTKTYTPACNTWYRRYKRPSNQNIHIYKFRYKYTFIYVSKKKEYACTYYTLNDVWNGTVIVVFPHVK